MRNKNIYWMYAIAFLQGMVFYGSIATLYRQERGVSVWQITVIESISLALCLILEFPWGIVADRIGYRKTIIICNLLYLISKIVFWQASGFAAFLLERILLSVVISGLSGVDSALLYLSCERSGRSDSQKVFGIYNSLGTAGLLSASFVFSVFVKDNYGLSALLTVVSYGIAALCAFGLAEVNTGTVPSGEKDSTEIWSLLKQTLRDGPLLLFLIGVAFFNETHQTITVFLNQLQYVKCGLSDTAIGFIYILVTVAGLSGTFSDKVTKRFGVPATAVFLPITAVLACVSLAFTKSPLCSVLGILVLRVAFSLFGPLQTELQNRRITASNRASALSIHAVIIDSVGIGTNVIFGAFAEYSLTAAMLFGALLCVVAGILLYRIVFHNFVRS